MLSKGVTVLICTHNGAKSLPVTLQHLALQQVAAHLPWEIIMVNNASTDGCEKIAVDIWDKLDATIPFTIINEHRPGKDNAIDLGLNSAKYSCVIICDDDNWLNDNYVQNAFDIIEQNPEVGMLGGKSIPEFEINPPKWFERHKVYYAVGEQAKYNGEVKHYWPNYRFIWGAGSVINIDAYNFLQTNGFRRILTASERPKVARSEDLELCFAIWLAGYKIWYSDKLVFKHHISAEKLKWSYFMHMLKQSVSAIHYLRPYNILLFTGAEKAPSRSYWLQYLSYFWKSLRSKINTTNDLKTLIRLLAGRHQETHHHFLIAVAWYQFYACLRLGNGYDKIFKRVLDFKKKMSISKI